MQKPATAATAATAAAKQSSQELERHRGAFAIKMWLMKKKHETWPWIFFGSEDGKLTQRPSGVLAAPSFRLHGPES